MGGRKFSVSTELTAQACNGREVLMAVEIIKNGPAPHNMIFKVYFNTQDAVEVDLEHDVRSLLAGQDRNNPVLIGAVASDWLQMLIDDGPIGSPSKFLLTDLPPDDPDRTIDPGLPGSFHARVVPEDEIGQGGNAVDIYRPTALVGGTATHIIHRAILVTFVWDADANVYHPVAERPQILR